MFPGVDKFHQVCNQAHRAERRATTRAGIGNHFREHFAGTDIELGRHEMRKTVQVWGLQFTSIIHPADREEHWYNWPLI